MKETVYGISLAFPCSIALLADIHNRDMSAAIDSLRFHMPDIILIAGDLIYGKPKGTGLLMTESKNSLRFLSACSKTAPTYISLGNHEKLLSAQDLKIIRSTGCYVLDNRWIEHRIGKQLFQIGGLTSARCLEYREYRNNLDTKERYPLPQSEKNTHPIPDLEWLKEFEKKPGYRILLSHHPEYYPLYLRERSIDLICSGHAHGGQIRIFDQGLYAPGQGIFPKYTSGVHDGRFVVTRGLSNTTIIPRINNPTEIVYLRGHKG